MGEIELLKKFMSYGSLRTLVTYHAWKQKPVGAENRIKLGITELAQPLLYLSVVKLEKGSKSYDEKEDIFIRNRQISSIYSGFCIGIDNREERWYNIVQFTMDNKGDNKGLKLERYLRRKGIIFNPILGPSLDRAMHTNELRINDGNPSVECTINVGEGSYDYLICTGIESLEQILRLCEHNGIKPEFMEKHRVALQEASRDEKWKELLKTYIENSFKF